MASAAGGNTQSRFLQVVQALRARRPAGLSMRGEQDATGHVEMRLSQMLPGEVGHILSLCSECAVRPHLLELGFTQGTEVEFVRVAPLSDPLTVRIRGYQLSLRRREADAVWVRVCPPDFDNILPEPESGDVPPGE